MRGPKQKYSKQLLLEKGLAYVNEFGMSNLSFRKFATYIGCSTQPIISSFGNLETLILELGIAIERFYYDYTSQFVKEEKDSFLTVGLAYISFANEYSNYFHSLFLMDYFKKESFSAFFTDEESQSFVRDLAHTLNLSETVALKLLRNMWLTTHGIATFAYTNQVDLDHSEIEEILQQNFQGLLSVLK
ncbi:TetR/AcrR family transcriptional regulator [Streptococcus parauberis]|uniref:TetR/AcrR family transcriptional regulator n=1 Tax=Streptococcus parauberis TaxID=1348 RepID=UPI000CCF0334|nr:TetR/AcrR family transcriptional regulator [Streptococcus parauberis]PNY19545.1 hypothetical protein ASN86_01407 [Streptococcus parauberis]